jgi:hypothetical protein
MNNKRKMKKKKKKYLSMIAAFPGLAQRGKKKRNSSPILKEEFHQLRRGSMDCPHGL